MNEELEALTYVAGKKFICAEGKPSEGYLNLILSGARTHKLEDQYIEMIRNLGR